MAVMAAGVHPVRDLAGVRQPGCFLHRQCVHVGPKTDRGLPVAIAQHAHHAGFADAAMHLDPPFLQLPRNKLRGAVFLQSQFGMGVNVAADGG